jgi:predicted secreted protein
MGYAVLTATLCVLVLSLFPGPPASARPPQAARTIVVGDEDDGREVSLRRGDTLVVRLGARLGTGYGWRVVRDGGRRLRPLGEAIEPGGEGEGGVEFQVFRFKALSRGAAAVVLHYKRPWEKGHAKTFTLRVRVR